ncbi:bifunctional salicylyl-CoA 5-hydroxylase/oxidoreductase [Phenylobacterium sp.]|uniref:bifunctional salicylyl-CoA 5-hydroxylase/oxidoreductase n=1 Tax=Phenylobacterium sp. TaxID=1871053 RepID=UPI0027350D3E|nr:bifunctional salicylyl-CoA 5-hydroxylase/oxidoreductase [Phenylobacterium sp.]MDP3853662.1 bifunctional salicylyl-CoA 5-hydroxylase/oxidoreductase [Phenylobacterium sp.]
MNISVIGAGPAGLYFSILMKKARPNADITIVERNRSGDTFGFGVVFSDQTLDIFQKYDRESHAAILDNFTYWDDIEIDFKGEKIRVGGNGFCGCARRTLLELLEARARELGVKLEFGREVEDLSAFADSDLIVAADGVNSRIRAADEAHFRTATDLRPNKFVWMGSTRPFDAFTFFFEETEYGVFIAHCYQYEAGRSTWVIETDPETFDRTGLADMDEETSARFLEGIFQRQLEGHGLITNRSLWRNFPMIRNGAWSKGNVVLLGDAKATAHFSIGAGTKLAMEDAIALFEAFEAEADAPAALARFEQARREDVEKTQHAADVSLVWFEQLARFWNYEPAKFAFGLMTRAKAITYDNLALRAPEFVERVTREFEQDQAARGLRTRGPDTPPMFQPYRLREMELANRVVLSPMCTYSADEGLPADWHLVHLGARALGGAGLIFTEMTTVSPTARITHGCAGIYTDEQEAGWRRVVEFAHANSAAKICLQLGHAGRKGATKLMWDGMDQPLEAGGWPLISASAIPYYPNSEIPRPMTSEDMDEVKADFLAAAVRGERAGFDMLELHCAHGYLLASFVSPLTNSRTDEYGGSLENRLRFPLEVFDAIRDVWPREKPMSVRISATDWKEGGVTAAESVAIAQAFAEHGCDLVDVSTGQTVPDAKPIFGRMFQTPFSDRIRNSVSVSTMCVGAISTPDQVNTILAAGRADLVAVGRGHLADPSFTLRAAAWYGVKLDCPPQYLPGFEAQTANSRREREDLLDLRRRAKPVGGKALATAALVGSRFAAE